MPLTVADITAHLAEFAPLKLAATWDNVGLLVGDPAAPVNRILTCLTLTPSVAAEAVRESVQLIVTHHPVLFRGVKTLTPATAEGRTLLPIFAQNIAVYSPHTAFDNCPGGINDGLAARFGLTDIAPLRPTKHTVGDRIKLVVFVLEADTDSLADALFAAGAGHMGHYKHCSFRTSGTGTFFGTEEANPQVGAAGQLERVAETRLEMIVPAERLATVVKALRATHRYEEPAFDLIPLGFEPGFPSATGEGRIGTLPAAEPLGEFAARIKSTLRANSVQIGGDLARPVRRVAVACGAAGEFLPDAIRAQADVFVTGELHFHEVLAATEAGVAVVVPGHYATERPAIEDLATRLAKAFPAAHVSASHADTDPLVGE